MNKIRVAICAGTTCYLMGAAHLQSLEDHLETEIKPFVEIDGNRCLGCCKTDQCGEAPYVAINGEVMSSATIPRVLDKIRELLGIQ